MGIFDILKKKAEISIILEKENFSYGEKIKGKIIINPLEDFTSNELDIGIGYKAYMDISGIDILENISRVNFGPKDFLKGNIIELEFEFNFLNNEEIENIILDQFNSEEEYLEVKDDLGIEDEEFFIFADFDIPGFDVSSKQKINLLK